MELKIYLRFQYPNEFSTFFVSFSKNLFIYLLFKLKQYRYTRHTDSFTALEFFMSRVVFPPFSLLSTKVLVFFCRFQRIHKIFSPLNIYYCNNVTLK